MLIRFISRISTQLSKKIINRFYLILLIGKISFDVMGIKRAAANKQYFRVLATDLGTIGYSCWPYVMSPTYSGLNRYGKSSRCFLVFLMTINTAVIKTDQGARDYYDPSI